MSDLGLHQRELEPLGDSDHKCLQEVRDVLKRHDKLERFGVTLLHDHFEMRPGEILVETCDEANRTLTLRPLAAEERETLNLAETSWRLLDGAALTGCYQTCVVQQGHHSWRHVVRR